MATYVCLTCCPAGVRGVGSGHAVGLPDVHLHTAGTIVASACTGIYYNQYAKIMSEDFNFVVTLLAFAVLIMS